MTTKLKTIAFDIDDILFDVHAIETCGIARVAVVEHFAEKHKCSLSLVRGSVRYLVRSGLWVERKEPKSLLKLHPVLP